MNIQIMREFLMWCTIINYGILILWWLLFSKAHDAINRLLCRWVINLPVEKMDTMQLYGITLYKLAIILFNFVPFIATCIVMR